jgi:hypothetical protein
MAVSADAHVTPVAPEGSARSCRRRGRSCSHPLFAAALFEPIRLRANTEAVGPD